MSKHNVTSDSRPIAPVPSQQKTVRERMGGERGYYSYTGYKSSSDFGLSVGTTGVSGRKTMEGKRETIVQASRELYRTNCIYNGIINSAVDYIVGTGNKLQIIAVNPEEQKEANKLESLFRTFWRSPEIKGLPGYEVERMVIKEVFLCGDILSIKVKESGKLQLIESEQITGRKSSGYDDGILTDDYGVIKSFNVLPYVNGYVGYKGGKEISVDDSIFVSTVDRPSDVRAVPPAQAAFPMFHRINDLCDSEAIAAQTLARFAVAITAEGAGNNAYTNSVSDSTSTLESPVTNRVQDLGYALIFNGGAGEKVEGISRNIPGKDFPATIRTFLRLLGLPLGMPLEIIFLDWTQSNYSQSRAVLEHARRKFSSWQRMLQDKFLTQVLDWKYRQYVQMGLVNKFEYTPVWIGPAFPWLDPQKEADAMARQIETAQATQHEALQSQGKDYDNVIQIRTQEIEKALEIVNGLEEKYDVKVPFEVFAGLPYPNKSDNKSETTNETETETQTEEVMEESADE